MRHSLKQILRGLPVALAVTFVVPAAFPTAVSAQSVDQQRQKVEDIVDELERLEERARQLGEDYNEAIDTKGQLDVEIAEAEARIAEQEAEEAFHPIHLLTRRALVIFGVSTVFILVIVYWAIGTVTRPMKLLGESVDSFAEGQFQKAIVIMIICLQWEQDGALPETRAQLLLK